MVQKQAKNPNKRVEPLVSRHVFLDTQVYRALGHSPTNRAMGLLKQQIEMHRIVLHITDITLMEVRRQIRERVLTRQREIKSLEKDLSHWRKIAPGTLNDAIDIDVASLSDALYEKFSIFLIENCNIKIHRALSVKPAIVFQKYFERKPPFDGENSKEFPDGFVIEVLSDWCQKNKKKIYVVTEDNAMLRAVDASSSLEGLKDIHDLLARAAADLSKRGESAAESALNKQAFDSSFVSTMQDAVPDLVFVYVGDLADGEAYGGDLDSVVEINDWTVVGLNDEYVDVILTTKLIVSVEVQYEDRDDAIYDKEDDHWFGAESTSTEIENEIEVEVLVEIERETGKIRDAKLLTQEVQIR